MYLLLLSGKPLWLTSTRMDEIMHCHQDGLELFFGLFKDILYVMDANRRQFIFNVTVPLPGHKMAFSPDCGHVVIAHDTFVSVISVSEEPHQVTTYRTGITGISGTCIT